MEIGTLLKHYKRRDVQEEIIINSQNKEVAFIYGEKGFGQRPDVLRHASDVLELAKNGVTSFHASEEIWSNPLRLDAALKKKELEDLRKGWDLVIDIDCPILDYSQIAADLIIKAIMSKGINSVSAKFSVMGDTPVLIKIDKKIKLISIANAVSEFKKGKKLRVFSLNKENKLVFSHVCDTLEHNEVIYEIYHKQSGLPLKATGHHSVFVWEKGKIAEKKVSEIKKNDILISFNSDNKRLKKQLSIEHDFDYFKNKILRNIKLRKNILRLIGYYISEGHLAKINNQIGFSFNSNEIDYINDCKNILITLTKGLHSVGLRNPNKSSTQIILYSKEWYSFFEKNCGKGSHNKKLPDFVWMLDKKNVLEILKGYLRGDGDKSGKYITAKSVSKQLINELVWLCKLNGISCALYREHTRSHRMPQGTIFKGSEVYILKIPRTEILLKEFSKIRKKFAKLPSDKLLPTDALEEVYKYAKPKYFNKHRNEQMTLHKKFANRERINLVIKWIKKYNAVALNDHCKKIIKQYKKLIHSSISFIPVRKITKGKVEKVYDLSVDNTERFFGGQYPILLHNSGNHGFHIAVPFEAFPDKIKLNEIVDTKMYFPDGVRMIAGYLGEMIKKRLAEEMLKREKIDEIVKRSGKKFNEIVVNGTFDPFKVLNIDTVLISSRHLYRMPYSFNEKSGLVSIPLDIRKISQFKKEFAKPENVVVDEKIRFMDRRNVREGEARHLFDDAIYWHISKNKVIEEMRKIEDKNKSERRVVLESALSEEFFPPCIKKILSGLEDGKKRSLFILINFLTSVGWDHDKMEILIRKWNEKNKEPLREVYFMGQLSYHKQQRKKILPPNCANTMYYKDLQICVPDNLCSRIKNPVNYSIIKVRRVSENQVKKGKAA